MHQLQRSQQGQKEEVPKARLSDSRGRRRQKLREKCAAATSRKLTVKIIRDLKVLVEYCL